MKKTIFIQPKQRSAIITLGIGHDVKVEELLKSVELESNQSRDGSF